jgi:hypothetical protein
MSSHIINVPLKAEELDALREKATKQEQVKRDKKFIAFAAGQNQAELFSVSDGEWIISSLEVDGAAFGDGLNSFCEAFIDNTGYFDVAAPSGIRIAAGYFGGFTPFHFGGDGASRRIRSGESAYLALENGTSAEVSVAVEWEIRRVK